LTDVEQLLEKRDVEPQHLRGLRGDRMARIMGHPREREHACHLPPDRGRHEEPLTPDLLEALDHSSDHDPERVCHLATIEHVFTGLERDPLAVLRKPIKLLVREALENVQRP